MERKFVGISNGIKTAIKLGIFLICTIYFIYHAITGKNGIMAYFTVSQELQQKKIDLDKIKYDINILEQNISLIDNVIDRDMLEEQCIRILNYIYKDDFIVKN